MSFRPAIPVDGLVGWAFLKRTEPRQRAAFAAAPAQQRDEDYFRARIGSVRTADDLMADRRLLRVALGAFGLEGDINSRAFIRKVLTDGTLREGALSNRLADKQYRAFSAAFGFGDFAIPRTQLSDFADGILSSWRTRRFEAAVGEQSNTLRLALNAEREVAQLAGRRVSDETMWFTMMGNAPLREVFETALRLPKSFGALDLDRQLATFRARAEAAFGSSRFDQFATPEGSADLVRRFLVVAETPVAGAATAPGSAALALLQSQPPLSTLRR
ncbi:MAG TPA: DUF1217 domain-containing protein [Paracoccaceae bacterium]|mgnify:CR=1 FL=1|nr:DUF1217 domain-containing protein [Paracoccaceae bacterium]HMO73484.1 DUF1217 domain-containing protein [Paracoccaceae bacterium]